MIEKTDGGKKRASIEERLLEYAAVCIGLAESLPASYLSRHLCGQLIRAGIAAKRTSVSRCRGKLLKSPSPSPGPPHSSASLTLSSKPPAKNPHVAHRRNSSSSSFIDRFLL